MPWPILMSHKSSWPSLLPWPTLRGPQIFVAHFDFVGDVMMTKWLGLASELMVAEVISKKKVTASPMPRMASPRAESELMRKEK